MKWIVQIPENHFGTGLHTFDRKWLAVSFASRWMDVSGKFPPKPKIYKGKYLKGAEISWAKVITPRYTDEPRSIDKSGLTGL